MGIFKGWRREAAIYFFMFGLLQSACNFQVRETEEVSSPTAAVPPTSIVLPTEFSTVTPGIPETPIPTERTPTATATDAVPAATETEPPVPPTGTEPASASPTPTTPEGDSGLPSGNPTWKEAFTTSDNWFRGGTKFEDEYTKFEILNGKMAMIAFNPDFREGWVLSWPKPENFYLEGRFKTVDCSGGDRFGLFLRAENVSENPRGYLFGIRCDGRYSLRIFDGKFSELIDWTPNDKIEVGSGKSHLLGIWANGNLLRLYIDRQQVAEFEDNTFKSGPFGVFIGSAQTSNMSVEVDELSYWNIP
ncbi:MAG: hypothetical protein IIC78_01030 [Chloroflexi bacterium]|nr:hypothetical protein [Chloroflexota bacterium]